MEIYRYTLRDRVRGIFTVLASVAVLVAFSFATASAQASVPSALSPLLAIDSEEPPAPLCTSEKVALDIAFPTGNIEICHPQGAAQFHLTIAPEDEPINCSAWYAFRLSPRNPRAPSQTAPQQTTPQPTKVQVTLDYTICGHRYTPKISADGQNWHRIDQDNITIEGEGDKKRAILTIELRDKPLFVAAQEIFPPAAYAAWMQRMARSPAATRSVLGKSPQGRNIELLQIKEPNSTPREQIILIGRQHPPEVTGALAMVAFVETLLADTPLARRYRARFETLAVPLMNPDGVALGHWRHNTGGVDLNRDWGTFAQPETQIVHNMIENIASAPNKNLRLLLDFHSTYRDVFYTIPDANPTNPPLFIRDWLADYQQRMPDYEVNRDQYHNAASTVSKAYAYERYGIPAVTFEIGDETDRELIRRIAQQSAQAMMETKLSLDTKLETSDSSESSSEER